jgi:hypothetical protein
MPRLRLQIDFDVPEYYKRVPKEFFKNHPESIDFDLLRSQGNIKAEIIDITDGEPSNLDLGHISIL